jgi:ABC-type antimicrobial peptide transport system permease subunit
MFFTYVYRELRRRHRQALLTALGLAVGVGLVVAVTAYAGGVSAAQDTVLHSLYGVGTDITVSQTQKLAQSGPQQFNMNPGSQRKQGKAFSRDSVRSAPGQQSIRMTRVASLKSLDGVAQAVGGLTLTSTHVSGNFAKALSRGNAQPPVAGSGSSSSSSSQTAPSASQAPIKISSFSISGVDVSQTGLGPLSSTELVSGRTFTSSETTTKVAVLDKAYAKQNSYALGDTIKISGSKYTVIGLVTSSAGSSSTTNVYIPLTLAQKMSGNTGKVNQIYVRAASSNDIAAVKTEIKAVLPKATVTTAQDLATQVSGSLKSASQLADTLGKWLAIAALIAAFAVASLLTVAAVSRRVREFGTLKALGWKSRRVVGQVMGESVVQGVLGGVIGVVIGVVSARLIAHFSPLLKATVGQTAATQAGPGAPPGATGALSQAAQTVAVHLTAPVSIQLVLLAVGLALTGGILAGAFGGWRASRLRPADALRRVD